MESTIKEIIAPEDGMTLRDYFAAQMMVWELGVEVRPHREYNYRNAAIRAYRMADAMLAQRENKNEQF